MPCYAAAEERQPEIDQCQMHPAAYKIVDEHCATANAQRLACEMLEGVRLKMMSEE